MLDAQKLREDRAILSCNDRFFLRWPEEKERESYLQAMQVISEETKQTCRHLTWEHLQSMLNNASTVTCSVYDRGSGRYAGYCQYNELQKDIPGLGIELLPAFQKKGLGYAVCSSMIGYLFEQTDTERICYKTKAENEASIALAKKLGAVFLRAYDCTDEMIASIRAKAEEKGWSADKVAHYEALLIQSRDELRENGEVSEILEYVIEKRT